MIALAFVVLAATGTLLRWQAGSVLGRRTGVLLVNIAGSFALGLLSGSDTATTTALGVGGLGALTTFSSFIEQTVDLARRRPAAAAGYTSITIGASLAAAAIGLALA